MKFTAPAKAGKAKDRKDPLHRHSVIQFECKYEWPKGQESHADRMEVTKQTTVQPGPGWDGVNSLVTTVGKDAAGILCGAIVEAIGAAGGVEKTLASLRDSEEFFLAFETKKAKKAG